MEEKLRVLEELIRTRRTIRYFTSDEIPKETIVKILDITRWIPTGSNLQDLRFIIVTNKKILRLIKMFSPGWIGDANPIAIVICSDLKWALEKGGPHAAQWLNYIHVGIAFQTIALLAHSLGLGTNPIVSFSRNAIKTILGLLDHIEPIMIVLIGKPKIIPEPTPRISLDKISTWIE
ncbi:MAG: nitroreductase family protein [Sulfolobales archaeon]